MLGNNLLANYGKVEFWEEFYQKHPEPFDWYNVYSNIKDYIIKDNINQTDKILVIGCGNSRLSEELYEDNYKDITNIDYSPTVIRLMEERCHAKCKEMKWKEMDVLDMKAFGCEFNAIIDKGTLDSVLCSDNAVPNANKMLDEVKKKLKPGGKYIVFSFGCPAIREKFLNKEFWTEYKCNKILKPPVGTAQAEEKKDYNPNDYHYIYIMTK